MLASAGMVNRWLFVDNQARSLLLIVLEGGVEMRRATFVLAALLLTAACGSMGDGGLGSIGDIILGSPSSTQSSDVKGTVGRDRHQRAPHRPERQLHQQPARQQQRPARVDLLRQQHPRVVPATSDYNVTDLERGDEIEVRGVNDNGRYIAQRSRW